MHIEIIIRGQIGRFSLAALLIQIISGMAVFALSESLTRWLSQKQFFVGDKRASINQRGLVERLPFPGDHIDNCGCLEPENDMTTMELLGKIATPEENNSFAAISYSTTKRLSQIQTDSNLPLVQSDER